MGIDGVAKSRVSATGSLEASEFGRPDESREITFLKFPIPPGISLKTVCSLNTLRINGFGHLLRPS